VNFEDNRVFDAITNRDDPQHEPVMRFVECLGLCHTIVTKEKEKNGEKYLEYDASSPDEKALVNGMRHFGFYFKDRDLDDNMLIEMQKFGNELRKYKLLHVLEFNSDRKRMSVILRDKDDRIYLICKGADSIIAERLAQGQELQDVT
jgi:phospholipid-translocating ATPase